MEKPKFPEGEINEEDKKGIERFITAAKSIAEKGDVKFAEEDLDAVEEGAEKSHVDKNETQEKGKGIEIKRNTPREIFFRVLANNYDFGIRVEEKSSKNEEEDDDLVNLHFDSINEERGEVIDKLMHDETIRKLIKEDFTNKDYNEAREKDLFPLSVADGLLARTNLKHGLTSRETLEDMNIEPVSNEELRELISKNVERVLSDK